ncbi:MAG: transporter substrate-binding domain-containing protein [Starkeya sp.]|nr:transporter substrate-binding domain-containing protein [Starkeya sp.]
MPSLYRPFTKQWLYFDRRFNEMVYQIPRLFPTAGCQNLVILVKARWSNGQIALITDKPPAFTPDGGEQCFPLYLYDEAAQTSDDDLFAEPVEGGLRRRDAITHAGLTHFQSAYPGDSISKEDLFYYVYGILHSPDYRERFADNLSKELPRIPAVKKAADFWAFSKAGRALADLHLNYETIAPYPLTIDAKGTLTNADYRVEKMKLAKKGDKTTVIYNHRITLKGIPEAAWDYVVNGKADAFIYDSPYNVVAVGKFGAGKLLFLDQPFTYEPLAFGLKKGDYDSINFINNFLKQIHEDGTYDRLHDKWFKSTDWLKDME